MSDKPEEKKLKLPIKGHDKCPDCGCEDRIGQTKIAELVEEGLIDEKLFPKGPTWAIPLFDQTKPIMVSPLSIEKPKIPILSIYWDICANPECLGIYVTNVDFRMQEIKIPEAPVQPARGGQQFPSGFPFSRG